MNLTKRSELGRLPARGSHGIELIHSILDAGLLAHIGFEADGQPFVIPTLHGRDADKLYFHGSSASRMLRAVEAGCPACVTVPLGASVSSSMRPALQISLRRHMTRRAVKMIALGLFALAHTLGAARFAQAQDAKTLYPTSMAPLDQYLMDRNAEIDLERSAGNSVADAAQSHPRVGVCSVHAEFL